MPKISIVIPTCNRPGLLTRALESVAAQTFKDFEVVVVDDGEKSAKPAVDAFHDSRFRYVKHDTPRRGGSAARNTGIKASRAPVIAFLDDDDRWLPEKLALQYAEFSNTPADVGFSVTGARIEEEGGIHENSVKAGVQDFSQIALVLFKGFLTPTLMVKREVLDSVGMFDETLPSHQETDLIIRITRRYKGLGVNQPLSIMDLTPHEHIGGDLSRRIQGREMLLQKHREEFKKTPAALAQWYFGLGLYYRDNGELGNAAENFKKAVATSWRVRYAIHYVACRYAPAVYSLLLR